MRPKENYDEFSTKFAHFAEDNGFHTAHMQPLPIKFNIYYHLLDDIWTKYSEGSRLIYGVNLPSRLNSCDKMPEPIIVATYMAPPDDDGQHPNKNLSQNDVVDILKQNGIADYYSYSAMHRIYGVCRVFFKKAYEYAYPRGVIIAKTSFSVGIDCNRKIYFTDEFLTPNTTLFWDAGDFYYGEYPKPLTEHAKLLKALF
ncbi:hypothetical protein IKF02_00625 [Candidatus Saccharibacteria bacterium]|nr:hypothetical protein [Candidatus Saccharibacteria bacterium]